MPAANRRAPLVGWVGLWVLVCLGGSSLGWEWISFLSFLEEGGLGVEGSEGR